ncbi:hypothetical protein pb186bvf_019073 [Paramecium bursaria]
MMKNLDKKMKRQRNKKISQITGNSRSRAKSISIAIQTPKQFQIDQNELPKLLGYQIQLITNNQQPIYNDLYIEKGLFYNIIQVINKGYSIGRIQQNIDGFCRKTQLATIIHHSLRSQDSRIQVQLPTICEISLVYNNQWIFDRRGAGASLIHFKYNQIDTLLNKKVQKIREIQLICSEQYGWQWTQQFSESKIIKLMGQMTMLNNETILRIRQFLGFKIIIIISDPNKIYNFYQVNNDEFLVIINDSYVNFLNQVSIIGKQIQHDAWFNYEKPRKSPIRQSQFDFSNIKKFQYSFYLDKIMVARSLEINFEIKNFLKCI